MMLQDWKIEPVHGVRRAQSAACIAASFYTFVHIKAFLNTTQLIIFRKTW